MKSGAGPGEHSIRLGSAATPETGKAFSWSVGGGGGARFQLPIDGCPYTLTRSLSSHRYWGYTTKLGVRTGQESFTVRGAVDCLPLRWREGFAALKAADAFVT